jgi:GNAT superfamily N-acetyltransferase
MKHAISEAKKLGCQTITLQVSSGSYAEQFYKKLGFQTEFQVDILKS